MSKPSLDTLLVKKGTAAPAVIDAPPHAVPEPRKEETKETSIQVSNEPSQEVTEAPKRRRPWDGQDEMIKANYEVPQRVQTKLHQLKAWGRVKNIKGFVAHALEAAIDKEIARAEKEGY